MALQAGHNRIRPTAIGSSGPNLDAMTARQHGPSVVTSFDAAIEFSGDRNPSGVWSYDY